MSIDSAATAPTSIRITPDPLYRLSGPERAALEGRNAWGADGFGFDDFLDFVNPLQHIPGISTLYRAATGDEISAPARVLGGALLAGPAGLVASLIGAVAGQETGGDPGGHLLALLTGTGEESPPAPAERKTAMLYEAPFGPPAVPSPVRSPAASLPVIPAAALPAPSPEAAEREALLEKLGLLGRSLDDAQKEYQKIKTLDHQGGVLTDIMG